LSTGEICKITTSERQKDGYGWLDMDWVWNKVVEFEDDYLEKRTSTQQAQSGSTTVIGDMVMGDKVLGNKIDQNGIKGDNNTVGGSIDQHIEPQGKPAKKKFWTKTKIVGSILVGLATIAGAIFAGVQVWQNHQANKPQVEETTVLETPSAVNPAEEPPEAEEVK